MFFIIFCESFSAASGSVAPSGDIFLNSSHPHFIIYIYILQISLQRSDFVHHSPSKSCFIYCFPASEHQKCTAGLFITDLKILSLPSQGSMKLKIFLPTFGFLALYKHSQYFLLFFFNFLLCQTQNKCNMLI
jgi:hypothetical protein